MMFKIYTNGDYGDIQKALVNGETNEVIMQGDYYHDKISERINGFLTGVEYASRKPVWVDETEITKDHKLFEELDFYSE